MTSSTPTILYGTAWKEDRTQALTTLALQKGFRGIDTANQRKHYFEAGVGAALKEAYQSGLVRRKDLFLQTKFTYQRGQDHRLPYDPKATLTKQVQQSFQSSQDHLHTQHIDAYVLHGPWAREGWAPQDQETWAAMESIAQQGDITHLGVSNIGHEQLASLLDACTTPPRFVQNRCYAQLGWDLRVRALCAQHDIIYQGFSLLTANRHVLQHPFILDLATREHATPAQIIFRFSHAVGMLPLTGTTNAQHMEQDLSASAVNLTDEEVRTIEAISLRPPS